MWAIALKKRICKLKLQHKVLVYLVGFIFVILCLFYLVQVVFLKDFYMFVKERSVWKATKQINQSLKYGYDEERIQEIANSQDFCVYTYAAGEDGQPYFISLTAGNFRSCRSQQVFLDPYEDLYLKAYASKNGMASIIVNEKTETDEEEVRDMTSASIIHSKDGNQYVVLVNTRLSPVQSTIQTLQMQFFLLAIVIIAMAVALAFYLSHRIAKPIRITNEQAKQLRTGNYDVLFETKDYQEIQELNETLDTAAKELKKVDDLRKELIANMSHDLRTPLTMISGYGEMMRDIPGENNAENVQVIIDEANRLTTLVNEILDVSQIQAGVQSLRLEVFEITKQVEEISERICKLLKGTFSIQIESCGPVYVKGDALKLSQVIYNLITNAVNYSTQRKEIGIHQSVRNGVYRFAVEDFGDGISEALLPYVWDRYYKGKKSHVRAKLGSGIGLSIVKGILQMHQAEFGVESQEGKGSTFWFCLPIASEAVKQEAERNEKERLN